MGILDSLKSTLSGNTIKKAQLERLEESIKFAISDGEISDREVEYFNGFFEQSELSQLEFNDLKTDIFAQAVSHMIADRRVTPAEIALLDHIAERLNIPGNWRQWAEEEIGYYSLFYRIQSGEPLAVIYPPQIVLQKKETCHLFLQAQLMDEITTSNPFTAAKYGIHIPPQSLQYQNGQMYKPQFFFQGVVAVSTGHFAVTNKRLIFSGDRGSLSTDLNKILAIQMYPDGLGYSEYNGQKPYLIRFAPGKQAELAGLIISRVSREQ